MNENSLLEIYLCLQDNHICYYPINQKLYMNSKIPRDTNLSLGVINYWIKSKVHKCLYAGVWLSQRFANQTSALNT